MIAAEHTIIADIMHCSYVRTKSDVQLTRKSKKKEEEGKEETQKA